MSTDPIVRYLSVQSAHLPSFSSDGQSITFLADISGVQQAWRVPVGEPGQPPLWPEQLTFGSDRVMWQQQSPAVGDGRLLYSRDQGGNENFHLYLLDPATGGERCLTGGFDGVMHIPSGWTADGRAILFAANRDDATNFTLYTHDLAGGEDRVLWASDGSGYLRGATVSPGGQRLAFVRVGQSAVHELFELDRDGDRVRELSSEQKPARYGDIAYSGDGRSLYVITDRDSDYMHIARVDLVSGDWEKLIYPSWDVEMMALSPNGRYLVYAINEDGYSRLELVDLATGMARPGADMPPGLMGGGWEERLAFSPDSTMLAFPHTGPTHTSQIIVWSLDLGAPVEWWPVTQLSHGGLSPDAFAVPTLIHYPTFDERDIPAWYFGPEGEGPWPVVVIVHGGPESQARPAFNFLAQYLVSQGYAVLVPNVRGSTGYGSAYSKLDDVEKRLDSVTDLAYAARWLKAQPEIDGERIVVYGGSYGGFMVLAALAYHPELWAAAVNIVGISNFVTFLENTSDYRRAHRESEYGSLAHDRAFLERISPLNHTDQMRAPLLVIHGANDPRVPLSEAEQLVAQLEAQGKPVDLLVFDDEGHGVGKLKNKLVMYPAVARFLEEALGGDR